LQRALLKTLTIISVFDPEPQRIKPGSLMPAMQLSDADLNAVVSYMETLH